MAVAPMNRSPAKVFLILLSSYAFYWHARDWNTASRLMLTYALVDRGTVRIDGLDRHTGDLAKYQGHYYADKLPGLSMLATIPYAIERLALPAHPLNVAARTHWAADYGATLGTSGLASATIGAILASLAAGLGCGPRRSMLVGLAYGLATPAYVYATLAYGHQGAALGLIGAYTLLREAGRRPWPRAACAGFLAAMASVVELQVGPVSAILAAYLAVQVVIGRWPSRSIGAFAVGASVPTLGLLVYNTVAFGSPTDMGYFHERLELFSTVHSAGNPLGLRRPDWSVAPSLLWGRSRGLLVFAPILILWPPGLVALVVRRRWATAVVSTAACVAVLLVNLSYPNWDGGWCTGPRLLVPLLPFAVLPVAGLLAIDRRWAWPAATLGVVGFSLMIAFQGVGGRVPAYYPDPIRRVVGPIWAWGTPPAGWVGEPFDRSVLELAGLTIGDRRGPLLGLAAAQMAVVGITMRRRWAERRQPPLPPE